MPQQIASKMKPNKKNTRLINGPMRVTPLPRLNFRVNYYVVSESSRFSSGKLSAYGLRFAFRKSSTFTKNITVNPKI